jgi:CRISPR-associated endonuclease/helicase Cas3
MTIIHVQAQSEKMADHNPLGLKRWPLYHQMRTLESLRKHDLVMNTYNTGTGKTIASLLYLFDLNRSGKNVLFIAPTNALLAQHAADIDQFVADNSLDFKVQRVTAAEIRALATDVRSGETLQRLIRNYLEFEADTTRRQPIILVVNPDIFYYALYFRYGAHDRRNVFERFLTAFDYIVVDEFHYYDSKQLANFLFAFALFDQFGYFNVRDRKVCLLSATPAEPIVTYLNRLFGDRWTRIGLDNEPPESAYLPTVPSLAPLELTIASGNLTEWAETHRHHLVEQVVRDKSDGALISSSLATVNTVYALLRSVLAETRMGRITGPEPEEERIKATARSLILATPTVDIGYNFVKLNKARQNIDFVVCDARYGDELLQRVGRAGRVLGKQETTTPSRAVAVVSPDAAGALASYNGKNLTRAEFAQIVRQCEHLPPKHNLDGYIRTHAITESFWPIYQISKVIPDDLQNEIEALFERVREVFAPQSRRSIISLKKFFWKYDQRERWLVESKNKRIPQNRSTAEQVADWCAWLDPNQSRPDPVSLVPHLSRILARKVQQDSLLEFIQSQVEITRALFAFRDSFQGPIAVIYDPNHLFSSQTVNTYDLFHLVRNYRLSPPMTHTQFAQNCEPTDLQGDFYLKLLERREPSLRLSLVCESNDEREDFERKWCGAPVAITGIRLQASEPGSDMLAGVLDGQIVTAVAQKYLTMLIIPPCDVGAMKNRLRNSNLWDQQFTVRFPDGTNDERYRVLLGTAGFHAHAELQGYFQLKDRLKPDALIL